MQPWARLRGFSRTMPLKTRLAIDALAAALPANAEM